MSLAMLVGGAECGPSNPLQSLSKRFDQDRGAQQVRAGLWEVLGSLTILPHCRISSVARVQARLER
jgi:peroxin-5